MCHAAEIESVAGDPIDAEHDEVGAARTDFLQDRLFGRGVDAKRGTDVDVVTRCGCRSILEDGFFLRERNTGPAAPCAAVPRCRDVYEFQRILAYTRQSDGDFGAPP